MKTVALLRIAISFWIQAIPPLSVFAFSFPPIISSYPPPLLSLPALTAPTRTTTTTITTCRTKILSTSSLRAAREATFGMGCFWEPSETLLQQPGILATTVGYTTGGAAAPPIMAATSGSTTTTNTARRRPPPPPPTYDSVCFGNDYVEAVRVVYDDSLVTYETLLDYFYKYQKPGYSSRQYASVIFANDEKEKTMAERWKRERSSKRVGEKGGNDGSDFGYDNISIEPASPFYRAEEYHQRYWEKQRLRGLIGLLLIAGESGAYNTYVEKIVGTTVDDVLFGQSFDSLCGGLFLVGAGWMLVERLVARDVRELKPGDMIRHYL